MDESITQLGNYLLLEKMAQGGMAQVFKAKTSDPQGIERLVVIKRILPHISSDPEYVKMLVDEAKIAVHFNHGNVAQIYDLGRVNDDYFIVMEYVDGKTLGQIVREFKERKKQIPLEIIAYCISEVCRGLDYIHNKADADGRQLRVVHRDISPQNIIISYSGTVKIIDFGVAKADDKDSHTESGVLKGKFAYMSPEQAEGNPTDLRSDIFATGILLWELLTLDRLFKRKTNPETLKAVRSAHFSPPSKTRRDTPKDLEKIVEKALQKKKENRYQSASEMANDLLHFLLDHYPEFKRVDVAEFLYRYFGPEPDEAHLSPEMPQLDIKREKSPSFSDQADLTEDQEQTEIDYLAKLSGAVRSFFSLTLLFKKQTLLKTTLFFLVFVIPTIILSIIYWPVPQSVLLLMVYPREAKVYLGDQLQEGVKGNYQLKISPEEEIAIRVDQDGYTPYEETFLLQKREKRNLEVRLKKPIPPYGDLTITTDPPGAIVYLNGMEWPQRSPVQIPHLQSDKSYRLGFFLDGFQYVEETVEVKKGETRPVEVQLKRDYAELEIESNPPGALVLFDGQIVGQTPYQSRRIEPLKNIEFMVRMDGYTDINQSLIFKAGEKKKLSFNMQKNYDH